MVSTQSATQTRQVFEHHLGAFAEGIDAVMADYSAESVLLTPDKTYRGLAEIRAFFEAFINGADAAFWDAFKVLAQNIEGPTAYLVWEAKPAVQMATDTLLVHEGKILTQSFTALTGR